VPRDLAGEGRRVHRPEQLGRGGRAEQRQRLVHLLPDGQQPARPAAAPVLPGAPGAGAQIIRSGASAAVAGGHAGVSGVVAEAGLVPRLLGPAQLGAQAPGVRAVAGRHGPAHGGAQLVDARLQLVGGRDAGGPEHAADSTVTSRQFQCFPASSPRFGISGASATRGSSGTAGAAGTARRAAPAGPRPAPRPTSSPGRRAVPPVRPRAAGGAAGGRGAPARRAPRTPSPGPSRSGPGRPPPGTRRDAGSPASPSGPS